MTAFMLFAVVMLVLGNGFFVASEFSLVAIRRSRVDQLVAEGRGSAVVVQRAVANLDLYLAATQLGITITSLALGWIGEPALAVLIEPAFQWLPDAWGKAATHSAAVAIAFMIITALHIVLGELAPKSLAIQRPEAVALVVARPLEWFLVVLRPAIFVLNWLGNSVLRMFGLKAAQEGHSVHSAEELKMLIEAGAKEGTIGKEEGTLIKGVFRLADQPVGAVMTPRPKIKWLNLQSPIEEICRRIAETSFSRLPVAEGNAENIVGILEKRDLAATGLPRTIDDLKKVLRKALYIPDTAPSLKSIDVLREGKQDVAIVVNEFGGVEGLLTVQDVLFSIRASIAREVGETEKLKQPDGSWLLNAFMPIENLKDAFRLGELPDQTTYHTLGGFMLHQLAKIPRAGDSFEYGDYRFVVAEMLGTRIVHVRVHTVKKAQEPVEGGDGKAPASAKNGH
jgi:putative hemolysin